jgi:hypothetical protein
VEGSFLRKETSVFWAKKGFCNTYPIILYDTALFFSRRNQNGTTIAFILPGGFRLNAAYGESLSGRFCEKKEALSTPPAGQKIHFQGNQLENL